MSEWWFNAVSATKAIFTGLKVHEISPKIKEITFPPSCENMASNSERIMDK